MSEPGSELVHRLALSLGAELLETHISWVLLTAELAYKVKKRVKLPFVDYSTLERRKLFCEEEVRLNRRLAPSLYLGVSRITGTAGQPSIDGSGPVLEYAVRMRRFSDDALFSERLQSGLLDDDEVGDFSILLGESHERSPRCGVREDPAAFRARMLAALEGASPELGPAVRDSLRGWIEHRCSELELFRRRRDVDGFIRECHGDLHLANVVRLESGIAAFDCIEFDPALRCIDVVEDAAFPLMDFVARGRPELGWHFLNGWLEHTGDYAGLRGLHLYVVGRALVRAMVEHLRAPGGDAAQAYARTALRWSQPQRAALTITHGLPGSGKSFQSLHLARKGAIRIRSDVERKRIHGLGPLDDSRAKGIDLYTSSATRATYERLFGLARSCLEAGFAVVLDAAFLHSDERAQALALARQLGVPFSILACTAPPEVLRERITSRRGDASEADVTVLQKLSGRVDPLTPSELEVVMPDPAARSEAAGTSSAWARPCANPR